MLKEEARKVFLKKRRQLTASELSDLSQQINEKFQSLLPDQVSAVHIYLPIRSKNEVDTWPIIHELWEKERIVAVPVMDPDQHKLISYELTKSNELLENQWNVPEPVEKHRFDDSAIDMVVLPLLAFDKQGYRVGYGKGYYDRFLKKLRDDVLKVGLSYFPPIDQISNIDPWDVPMDYCVTPSDIIRF